MYNQSQTGQMAQQYQAYATAALTVGKVRQIVMLYDGVIRFIQRGVEAIKREDYETRYNQLAKASEVIAGMQSALDFESGGEIAKLLYDYYASIDARLFTVHRSNDAAVCEQLIKELRMMRDAWDGIDKLHAEETAAKVSAKDDATPAQGSDNSAKAETYVGVGVSA